MRAAALALLWLLHSTQIQAQSGDDRFGRLTIPSWVGNFTLATGNIAFGAVTAGVVQKIRHGSFRDGFTRGALGGALIYAGKRTAAADFDGSALVGRQIASVGASVVQNAAARKRMFEQVVLPLGPLRLYVDAARRTVQPKLDVVSAAWSVYAIAESQLVLDGSRTLQAGTLVFRTKNRVLKVKGADETANGLAPAGIVLLSDTDEGGPVLLEHAYRHELQHVLQEDMVLLAWTAPALSAGLNRSGAGRAVSRWVDFNISTEVFRIVQLAFPDHDDRPWELEAEYLARK